MCALVACSRKWYTFCLHYLWKLWKHISIGSEILCKWRPPCEFVCKSIKAIQRNIGITTSVFRYIWCYKNQFFNCIRIPQLVTVTILHISREKKTGRCQTNKSDPIEIECKLIIKWNDSIIIIIINRHGDGCLMMAPLFD